MSSTSPLLSRIGSKSSVNTLPTEGYSCNLIQALDSLESFDSLTLLEEKLKSLNASLCESLKSQESSKEVVLNDSFSSREISYLVNKRLTSGLDVTTLIKSGRLSIARCPTLLNELLKKKDEASIILLLNHVNDLSEVDYSKILLFSLTNECKIDLLQMIMEKPVLPLQMAACLRNFGSNQLYSFLEYLLDRLASEETKMSLKWISLLIDAHFSLLSMQPIFLPLLKRLHETINELLVHDQYAEGIIPILSALKTAEFVSKPSSVLTITSDYYVDRQIDI